MSDNTNREALNRAVAEFIGLPCCPGASSKWLEDVGLSECTKCKGRWHPDQLPDYCGSLDLISRAEAKVIEQVGYDKYFWSLANVCFAENRMIIATAEQRARAVLRAAGVEENG